MKRKQISDTSDMNGAGAFALVPFLSRFPIWAKYLLGLLFLGVLLGCVGEFLLRWVVSLAYAESFPIAAVNRMLSGRDVHSLSHYLAFFLRIWRIGFFALAGLVVWICTAHPVFRRSFPRLQIVVEGLLVFFSAACLLAQRLALHVGLYDEGLILTGAWTFSLGSVPYRDFYNIYGPGQVAVLGTLFALFGKSIAMAHLYDLFIRLGIVLAVWAILVPRVSPFLRLLTHLSLVCWLYRFGLTLYPVWPTLLCQLAALATLLCPSNTFRSTKRYVLGGLLAGAAILFRHDIGALFALLLFTGLWWKPLLPVPAVVRIRPPLEFALGILPLPLLAYASLLCLVSFPVLWRQLVQMPLSVFPAYRALPYPPPAALLFSPAETMPFYVFPFLPPFLASWVLFRTFREKTLSVPHRTVLLLALLSIAGIPQALGRSDFCHLIPLAIPVVPLFFTVLPPGKRFLPLAILFLLWSAVPVWHTIAKRIVLPLPSENVIPPEIPALRDAIRDCPPGPIFVGNCNHDCLVINNPGLYFLLDRPPATRYFYFEPAEVTTASVQTEIIGELESNRVETVILWDEPPHHEPNRSSEDSGVHILNDYIRANFRLVSETPPYSVWQRDLKLGAVFEMPLRQVCGG